MGESTHDIRLIKILERVAQKPDDEEEAVESPYLGFESDPVKSRGGRGEWYKGPLFSRIDII
jgi:hypothetical protein